MEKENMFGDMPDEQAFYILADMVVACDEFLAISRQKEEIYKEMQETLNKGCQKILEALREDNRQ